jgi:hypothetical protein
MDNQRLDQIERTLENLLLLQEQRERFYIQLDEQRREEEAKRREEEDKRRKENEIQTKQLNKQLGELGRSIGGIAEGMIRPSMEKVLRQKFKVDRIAEGGYTIHKQGETLEFDVFGVANGKQNIVVIVEAKARAREEHIPDFIDRINQAIKWLPEHKDKKFYAILAALQLPENVKRMAQKKGIYVAQVEEDVFDILEPKGFVPHDFNS